jgi:hypothetical protein
MYSDPTGLDTCRYVGREWLYVVDNIRTEYDPVFEREFVGPGPRGFRLSDCLPDPVRGPARLPRFPCVPIPVDAPWVYSVALYKVTVYQEEVARYRSVYRCVDECGNTYFHRQGPETELLDRYVIDRSFEYQTDARPLEQ